MFLDENRHPVSRQEFAFEDATLECDEGGEFGGTLILSFRSFHPDHPLQRLESVTLHLDSTPYRYGTRHARSHFHLRAAITDTTGAYTLKPFRARCHGGLLDPARCPRFIPLPAAELHAEQGPASANIWASGMPHRDPLHPTEQQAITTGGSTPRHRYDLPNFLGATAALDLYPGQNTQGDELQRESLANRGTPMSEPTWVAYPDLCISLPIHDTTREALHDEFTLLAALLIGITGRTLRVSGFHYPTPAGHVHHCALYIEDEPRERVRSPTLPLGTRVSLRSVLGTSWPRTKTLAAANFNIEALSNWFDMGKRLNPVEQGFLNLFIYLECLKAHWLTARHGIADTRNSFAGNVNRTLKDVLGYKQKINAYVDYRNNLVHEGASGLPRGDVFEHYCRLYRICAATYLSLLGWSGPYLAYNAQHNLEPTPLPTLLTPPDLTQLQAPAVVQ